MCNLQYCFFLNFYNNQTIMIKNVAKAVPAAYTSPYVEVVEMEINDSILVVSGENGNDGYLEEDWD